MRKFYLEEIITKDKLIHQGLYFEPRKKVETALLWIHGLASTFYSHAVLMDKLTEACEKHGWGFASFNNRGHDQLAGIKKVDRRKARGLTRVNGGAGCERFEECVYDIDAGICFLIKKGYQKIILIGHSSGANKVCYYAGTKRDQRVWAVALLSPISDRLAAGKAGNSRALVDKIQDARNLARDGHGSELQLGYMFFPITPNRYLSLCGERSNEDIFGYGDKIPKMQIYSQIKKPLFVGFGSVDEYRDRPIKRIKKVFDQYTCSKNYRSTIISDGLHSFEGKEKELVEQLAHWISNEVL